MVTIHQIIPEGLFLKIDVELVDVKDTALPAQVIHGILLLFSSNIKRKFVNELVLRNFPELKNGRSVLVLKI